MKLDLEPGATMNEDKSEGEPFEGTNFEEVYQEFKREHGGKSVEELKQMFDEMCKAPAIHEMIEEGRARIYVTFTQNRGKMPTNEKGERVPLSQTFGPYVDVHVYDDEMWVAEQYSDDTGESFILAEADSDLWDLADGDEESDARYSVRFHTYKPKG
jgi:hypothetical protein